MILFGDAIRFIDARERLAEIAQDAAPKPDTHEARVRVFLALADLTTAIADENSPDLIDAERSLRAALLVAARNVDASWRASSGERVPPEPLAQLLPAARELPFAPLRVKRPEGYAYYALYPEFYAEAARRACLPEDTCVIGLRSIGTGLAAIVAAACGASTFHTLRPHGDPFTRTVSLDDEIAKHAREASAVAIVDEGPGLSGSSFLGTSSALEAIGVDRARVHIFPSHDNGPGGAASDEARAAWETTRRHVVRFEDTIVEGGRLAAWIADLTGPLVEPKTDLSGGAWRELFAWRRRPPAFAMQERRKYLFTGRRGTWLAKFVGLSEFGADQCRLQERLARAGFVAPPAGLRHGFMVTPWIDGTPLETFASDDERRRFLDHLAGYLACRALEFPADDRTGADLATLAHMARRNISLATGCEPKDVRVPPDSRLRDLERALVRVRIDGRLHAWEWLRRDDGSFLKCDAINHHASHDLIGCQDIAWDIAGAAVEFGLDANELQALRDAIVSERATCPIESSSRSCGFFMPPSNSGSGPTHATARRPKKTGSPPRRASTSIGARRSTAMTDGSCR